MADPIGPVTDDYIDSIINANDPYNPNLNKTQGVQLRALVKLLRDRLEQQDALAYASLPDSVIFGLGLNAVGQQLTVDPGLWKIGTVFSTVNPSVFTLGPSDSTLSRYDVVYANNLGEIGVVAGVLAYNPVEPPLSANSIRVASVLVSPTAYTPSQPDLSGYVDLLTDQTLNSIKTFQKSPVVPAATNGDEAVNLAQLEDLISKIPLLSFNNGLTNDGNGNISLGGTLTQYTSIDAGTNFLFRVGNVLGVAASITVDPVNAQTQMIGGGSILNMQQDNVELFMASAVYGPRKSLLMNASIMSITDTINSKGLENADDYSANFTDNSLVTKKYVDGLAGGGFANPMTALGDLIYGATNGAATRLPGNTTVVQKFLTQAGTGSASAAPDFFDLFGGNNAFTGTQTFVNDIIVNGVTAGIGSGNASNTTLGFEALPVNTGQQNTAIGQWALTVNSSAWNNTAVGAQALSAATTGGNNTAVGALTMAFNNSGTDNTTIGYQAGEQITGSHNTIIGSQAGNSYSDISGNVFIGYGAGALESGSNRLIIANSLTTTPLIYGDFSTSSLTINGNLLAVGIIQLNGYTVSTLPAGITGMTAYVTDALTPSFGAALTGGGSVVTKAFFNGTNWIAG